MQANETCRPGCDPGFYRNRWNNSCTACHGDCNACEGPSSASCLSCISPKYLLTNSTGGYCLAGCPQVGYVSITSSACRACHPTCQTCSSELASGCTACASQLYLESNRCRYVCSSGRYPDVATRTCLACNGNCRFCFGGTVDNCTRCQTGLVLNNFTCASACPTGQAPNNFSVCERTAVRAHGSTIRLITVTMLFLILVIVR